LWLLIWWSLEAYMVVNFRARGINQGARKLTRTSTLNLKKNLVSRNRITPTFSVILFIFAVLFAWFPSRFQHSSPPVPNTVSSHPITDRNFTNSTNMIHKWTRRRWVSILSVTNFDTHGFAKLEKIDKNNFIWLAMYNDTF